MKKTFLIGKFWDPDSTMDALKQLKQDNVVVHDVYTPFPIHGIEPYLDIKRTRLTVASFIYGGMGLATALFMMVYILGFDWPMNIGGKPSLAWVDFVPISFELTVLFAAHGMVLTFLIVGQYWPGKQAKLFDARQTDDVFVVAIDKNKIDDQAAVTHALTHHGAYEISEKEL